MFLFYTLGKQKQKKFGQVSWSFQGYRKEMITWIGFVSGSCDISIQEKPSKHLFIQVH